MLPGTYFTNISLSGKIGDDQELLNRIVDASVFKVQKVKDHNFMGLVRMDQYSVIKLLDENESSN